MNAKSQNDSEAITMERIGIGIGFDFYQNGKTLTFKQLLSLTKDNAEAYKYIIRADNLNVSSVFFGTLGGIGMGLSLGYALGSFISGKSVDMKIFLPTLLAGSGLTICAITFDILSKNNFRKGIDIYNHSIKQNNSNIDFGLSTNGMMFKLNF
jgi:hypothetical protein